MARVTLWPHDDSAPDIAAGDLLTNPATGARWLLTSVRRVATRDGARRFAATTLRLREGEPDPPGNRFALDRRRRRRRPAGAAEG